jgi:hypothetical protein
MCGGEKADISARLRSSVSLAVNVRGRGVVFEEVRDDEVVGGHGAAERQRLLDAKDHVAHDGSVEDADLTAHIVVAVLQHEDRSVSFAPEYCFHCAAGATGSFKPPFADGFGPPIAFKNLLVA